MSAEKTTFDQLGLAPELLAVLQELGYESPTPIQAATIPDLLEGNDVVGQAQTGTGKTAAFALPLLNRLKVEHKHPQILVLTPTRELAIQVAEAFQRYASKIKGFHVLPIYGGQGYTSQLKQLKRGPQVIVGTPGRVMDHMRRKSLQLDKLSALVLDEADEMLKMGFIDDVDWILEQTPETRQTALFSATMPDAIRRIAQKHLNNPKEITIKVQTTTAETINQRYWLVQGVHKLDALTRILEVEDFDAILIFVRTRNSTTELAERLQARGYAASALNGDIAQDQRERTVNRLKKGELDILVATDVAARGLDVDRISHVINYDIPYDTEAYVHRVGRTGRAGRSGEAILFVAPRERRLLRAIENATRKPIQLMELPSAAVVNDQRIAQFKQKITDTLEAGDMGFFNKLIEQYHQETETPYQDAAAALAKLLQGDTPLLIKDAPRRAKQDFQSKRDGGRHDRGRGQDRGKPARFHEQVATEEGMERYRLDVGHAHGVKPGNIVGAIANEAGIDSKYIGQIKIHDDHSTVDLPDQMPKEIFQILRKARVAGRKLDLSLASEDAPPGKPKYKGKPKKHRQ